MADSAASLTSTSGYDDSEDGIDALHDDLLRHIIARLPVRDAASTAVLASRWRHLWRSSPLVLDDAHLPQLERAATVARILADHPSPFRTIRLRRCRFDSLDCELAEWPRLLAAKGTQELVLFNKAAQPNPAGLPADILRCASLQRLSLASWKLPVDLSGIILPHLRMLHLISIDMSELDLDYLLAASPVLHTLTLARIKHSCRVHLRSQSLRCLFAGLSRVEDFAVVDAPLLESLVLLETNIYRVRFKIACAHNLRVLGYLDPGVHKLHIGGNVIRLDTIAKPSVVVPGLKILALRVNFRVFLEVKMLANFLGCFPDINTLHIESAMYCPSATTYRITGEDHAKFWKEASAIKRSRSHLKRVVIHKFRGHRNEFEFLKFIARDAPELECLLIVPLLESFASSNEVNEMIDNLGCPERAWASEVLLVSPKDDIALNLQKATDLSIDDPFCS